AQLDAAQRRTAEIDRRLHAIESAERDRQAQLTRADEQLRLLNAQLDQARAQTVNLADLGARLDGIDELIRGLRGATDEIRRTVETGGADETAQRQEIANRIATIEQRLHQARVRAGLDPAVDPNDIPALPVDIMNGARQALTARDYERARALATALLQRAPTDALADDARLLVAESLVQQGRNANAVQEFQRLLNDFPGSELIPQALTDMTEALIRLQLCDPAQRTLRILIDRYGTTPAGQAGRRRLEEVRHLPRAQCQG
ncbi:MAG: tetratricopeptide repeat protein, partial [Deltaproteobacteria bacterium]